MARFSRLTALALVLSVGSPLSAQLNGSIDTTDIEGRIEHVFENAGQVYLAGGPGLDGSLSGEGLRDGTWVFQITDPSGSMLLSPEPLAMRTIEVVNGAFDHTRGGHAVETDARGARLVGLFPFIELHSRAEYKVWLTPVQSYSAGQGQFGFISSESKSTMFSLRENKTTSRILIRGRVFYDADNDGRFDRGQEEPIAGWKILLDEDQNTARFTDADGYYFFVRDFDTETHRLSSVFPPQAAGTLPGDTGPVGLPGGRWLHTSPTPLDLATGSTYKDILFDTRDLRVNWGNLFMVQSASAAIATSPGYWHNAGQATLAANDGNEEWRLLLNSLSLRTNTTIPGGEAGPNCPAPPVSSLFCVSSGTPFNTAFTELADYLTSSQAMGVLAFTLSRHFAAANLNREFGPMSQQTEIYIDQNQDDVLVSFDVMKAQTLALLSDPRSSDTGPDTLDPDWRDMVMMCLMEWSGMNTNGDSTYVPRAASVVFTSSQ